MNMIMILIMIMRRIMSICAKKRLWSPLILFPGLAQLLPRSRPWLQRRHQKISSGEIQFEKYFRGVTKMCYGSQMCLVWTQTKLHNQNVLQMNYPRQLKIYLYRKICCPDSGRCISLQTKYHHRLFSKKSDKAHIKGKMKWWVWRWWWQWRRRWWWRWWWRWLWW